MGPEVALIMAAVGTGMQVVGSIQQGMAANSAAKADAANMEANAKLAQMQGTERANRVRAQARRIMGEQAAAMAESGFLPSSGSNLDLVGQSAKEAALDIQTTQYEAELEALGLKHQASMRRAEGKMAKQKGFTDAAAAIFQGASTMHSFSQRATASSKTSSAPTSSGMGNYSAGGRLTGATW